MTARDARQLGAVSAHDVVPLRPGEVRVMFINSRRWRFWEPHAFYLYVQREAR